MAKQRGRSGGVATGGEKTRPAGPDLAVLRTRLRDIVTPVAAATEYDLEDLAVTRVGRRYVVRVVVDGDDGVSLDGVADVSRAISTALDAAEEAGGELLTQEYQLEVSSPGIDRPLTRPRHWRRNVGRLVKVTIRDRGVAGRIVTASDAEVVLDLDGTAETIPFERLGPGRVQIEFARIDEIGDDDLEGVADEPEPADETGEDEA